MNLRPPDLSRWVMPAQHQAEAATPVHTPRFLYQRKEERKRYKKKLIK